MSLVFVSRATGALIYVLSNDHCPPHVHARHRGENWIARVGFSYVNGAAELISITPLKNAPLHRVLSRLLDDIHARLAECRQSWWMIQETTCLVNQWAAIAATGKIELLSERSPDAKQIADAIYEPSTKRLQVTFVDGTTTEVNTWA